MYALLNYCCLKNELSLVVNTVEAAEQSETVGMYIYISITYINIFIESWLRHPQKKMKERIQKRKEKNSVLRSYLFSSKPHFYLITQPYVLSSLVSLKDRLVHDTRGVVHRLGCRSANGVGSLRFSLFQAQ